ncbi:glycosyltransferase family 4 protein [Candidatus Woesearchaeota archaeon]|nr:glycosyltransferase family 4 protein [Candidatus Woesearchaeota archaeon]
MKIAIFHPQLRTFGGGELISLIIADSLSRKHEVTIYSPFNADKKELEKFFDVNLSRVEIRQLGFLSSLVSRIPFIKTLKTSFYVRDMMSIKGSDLIFDTGTNGQFFKKLKCKTACYINFTKFTALKKGWKSILNFLLIDPKEAYKYDLIISNSKFTQKAVRDYSHGKESIIINPPVKIDKINPKKKKKNYILSIGRFSPEKKHEVMIDAFKEFSRDVKGWELHLVGQFQPGYNEDYIKMLEQKAKGCQVVFHKNMPHEKLLKFTPECRIYWHARGYGETDPEEMENFGMCTVEAMAGGCVPIVINLGAQPEIVEHKVDGFCWDTPEELIIYTKKIINDPVLMRNLSQKAIAKSRKYSLQKFCAEIDKAISSL